MSGEAGRKASTKQAPGSLDLVRRFVNTRNRMRGYDLLGNAEEAGRWLFEAGYQADMAVGEEELKRLHALRESLRAILTIHTLGTSEQLRSDAAQLDELCASVTLRPGFDLEGRPRLVAVSGGSEQSVEDLLAAAIWAQHTGIWKRLKACANEDCRWIFYDHSKNRSGNWCVMEICGSRAKMRTYRQRHNPQASGTS
ncbi:MAG: CGNR zinc finger domain-containing protein [Rubrobacteraceae bacterium]